MTIFIVTNRATDWPTELSGVEIVDAKEYLANPRYSEPRGAKVFNLCRSYRYQSTGYYVSLLAEARGHKPIPSVTTVQDMKTSAVVRILSDDLSELVNKSLSSIRSDQFVLSIYFGCNMAKRYERLALRLFNQFPAPLLRAHFANTETGWQLRRMQAISANEVPNEHWAFVVESARQYFARRSNVAKKSQPNGYDMAILHAPDDPCPPSDNKALRKFLKAARDQGISAELITRDDYGRIAEYDALFIRDTTSVSHYTYRFARRAASEGMVVIDDPQSIVRCANKVYLAELLARHKVPTPKTQILHRDFAASYLETMEYPCVIKKPDSAFSQGVVKVANPDELKHWLDEFFATSDLIVAQEYLPTTFDWRIGIIDRTPLFACKYFMARGHWQIINRERAGAGRFGRAETVAIEDAPPKAVQVALKAANLIGDGLYGVDVKESNGKFHVIEVNDNPNIDHGYEDGILKDQIYEIIMRVFRKRIDQRKGGGMPAAPHFRPAQVGVTH